MWSPRKDGYLLSVFFDELFTGDEVISLLNACWKIEAFLSLDIRLNPLSTISLYRGLLRAITTLLIKKLNMPTVELEEVQGLEHPIVLNNDKRKSTLVFLHNK